MGVFDDIELGWDDRTYVIPAGKALGCIARVEDVVTLFELLRHSGNDTMPMAKVSQAYGAALRYAGAQVSDEDVYAGMFANGETSLAVMQATQGLLGMMLPKSALARTSFPSEKLQSDQGDGQPAKGKPSARKKRRGRSSRKRGKQLSAIAG